MLQFGYVGFANVYFYDRCSCMVLVGVGCSSATPQIILPRGWASERLTIFGVIYLAVCAWSATGPLSTMITRIIGEC